MDRIGLTGSTGSLGKIFLKKYRNKNIKCFKGDIRNKKLFNNCSSFINKQLDI